MSILTLRDRLGQSLYTSACHIAGETLPREMVTVERPREAAWGDYSTPVALQLSRRLKKAPPLVAQELIASLPAFAEIAAVNAAGPYINFVLHDEARASAIPAILEQGPRYGSGTWGNGRRLLLEYVSANPTGPLHVGHGRGAAYGASLANILRFAGYDISAEFYVNDAGRQMDSIALSTWLRYLQQKNALPASVSFPAKGYQGDYVWEMAQRLATQYGDALVRDLSAVQLPADEEAQLDALIEAARQGLGEQWPQVISHVLQWQLADCREDLTQFGVSFDRWYSEKSLFDNGKIAETIATLAQRGHTYVDDGALWFRAREFGDDKDRVLQRSNGQYTYLASDIAYHQDKLARGFDGLINIWGADHHGYIARMKGALSALGLHAERLEVILVQFAVLYERGAKMPMSTRAGEYVTLRQLREEVSNAAARFFYVLRKSDQHLDFDLDLARSQSNDNPVHYVCYAHARLCSIARQGPPLQRPPNIGNLQLPQERHLLRTLLEFPRIVELAARDRAPHTIAFHLQQLAADLHSYYNAHRILTEDSSVCQSRLGLGAAIAQVLRNGLALLGVQAPETM